MISSAPLSHTNLQKVNEWLAWCQTRLCGTIYVRGDFVTWHCLPSQWRLSSSACPVPWWGSGARINADTVAMPCQGGVPRTTYWTPSSYSAAPEEAASRFSCRPAKAVPKSAEGGDRGSNPQGPRYQASHYVRWLAPHHRSTHKPTKGKRVTGLMPDMAVRNNTYRRGDEVTWH